MAQQDLDAFLANLRGAGESAQSGLARLAELEKTKAVGRVGEMAPELLESGRFSDLAGMYAGLGEPSMVRDLMQNELKTKQAAASQSEGFTAEESAILADPNASRERKTQIIASKVTDPSAQSRIIRANVQLPEETKSRDINADIREQRQVKQDVLKDVRSWAKDVQSYEKNLISESRAFEKAKGALAQGTIPGDAIVLNFIARAVADEKGPLAKDDISRLKGDYLEEDWNKLMQYVNSKGKSTLPPEMRSAYEKLIKMTVDNYEKYKEDGIKERLGRISILPEAADNPEVKRIANKYGYKLEKSEEGWVVPTKILKKDYKNDQSKQAVSKSVRQDSAAPITEETSIIEVAQRIKDPTAKAQAEAAIKYYSEKNAPIPQQALEKIRQAAGGQ